MAEFLRVHDWSANFENNRTREIKRMAWVPMPTKHDGDGFTELLDHKDGMAHFGAWCLIVEVAAKCDPRGTLVRDGNLPHTPSTLARMTRGKRSVFAVAIDRLIKIGWLEVYGDPAVLPQEGATISQVPALHNNTEQEKTEENKTGQNRVAVARDVDLVFAHYKTYHPQARPGDVERRLVRARLGEGYTVPDLQAAIDGCHRTPWNCGVNNGGKKYQSLKLIMRDSSQVARFMEAPDTPILDSELSIRNAIVLEQFKREGDSHA